MIDVKIKEGSWLYPGVAKRWLILIAGLVWMGVGFMLCRLAAGWLIGYKAGSPYVYGITGVLAALMIHHYGFLKIVNKNLDRIALFTGKSCLFSFMSWKSYLLVAVMMTMGITMRHSSIPKQFLSVLYLAIGLALMLSSLRYIRKFITDVLVKSKEED
jgi:hypothetical protein